MTSTKQDVKYKAVIFDLGGVVLGSPLEGVAEYEREHDIPPDYVNICIKTNGANSAFSKLERNLVSLTQFYKDFKTELESPDQMKAYLAYKHLHKSKANGSEVESFKSRKLNFNVEELFFRMMSKSIKINRDMVHAIYILRGQGIITAALTNNVQPESKATSSEKASSGSTASKTFSGLSGLSLAGFGLFDEIVESSVVKLRKPDPRIYQYLCNKLHVQPSECIFLDDIGMNAKAAATLRMHAIKVDLGEKNVRKALDELHFVLSSANELDTSIRKLYIPSNLNIVEGALKAPKPITLFYDVGHDNGRIYVDCFGRLDDPIVIFLHGGGQTRHTWFATAQQIAANGMCALTVDMKGHGESYWHENASKDRALSEVPEGVHVLSDPTVVHTKYHKAGHTLDYFADDLDRLLEKLHLINGQRKCILVGASLGGLTILTSRKSKLACKAIVMVDISTKMEFKGTNRITTWMLETNKNGFESVGEALEIVKAYNPRVRQNAVSSKEGDVDVDAAERESTLSKNLIKGGDGRFYWHWDPAFIGGKIDSQEILDLAEKHLESNLDELNDADKEVLLVRGKMTDVVSYEGVETLRKKLNKFSFVDVKDAGHMVAGDQNDVFASEVVNFCKRFHTQSPEVSFSTPNIGDSFQKVEPGLDTENNKIASFARL